MSSRGPQRGGQSEVRHRSCALSTFRLEKFGPQDQQAAAPAPPVLHMGATGTKDAFPVKINVYNLVGGNATNAIISTVAGGGIYHTGVEVDGVEYAYGGGQGKGSGVWAQQPRKLPACFGGATFKESIPIGASEPISRQELHMRMHQMAREWRMCQYNMLPRNW